MQILCWLLPYPNPPLSNRRMVSDLEEQTTVDQNKYVTWHVLQ